MSDTILILDDDPDAVTTFAEVLDEYTVRAHTDAAAALADLDGVTLAIVDLHMPGIGGEGFIKAARVAQPGMKFLLMSGSEQAADVAERLRVPWIGKPCEVDQVIGVVRRLCR